MASYCLGNRVQTHEQADADGSSERVGGIWSGMNDDKIIPYLHSRFHQIEYFSRLELEKQRKEHIYAVSQ